MKNLYGKELFCFYLSILFGKKTFVFNGLLYYFTSIGFSFTRICLCAYMTGQWVYPILKVLNYYEKAIFIVSCGVLGVFFYKLGEIVNKLCWPKNKLDPLLVK